MASDTIEIDGHMVTLHGIGTQKKGLCPACSHLRKPMNQKERCLSVNISDGVYKCHNCTWSGTIEKNGHDLPPVPARYHKPEKPQKAYKKPGGRYSPSSITPAFLKWFEEERGISEETLVSEHIGYGTFYISEFESERKCAQFPYKRSGELVNVKHIHFADGKKYPRMETGAELIFYRLDHVDAEMVCITEGEIDALSLIEAGFDSVISVPNGAPAPGTKSYDTALTYLNSAEFVLNPVNKIVLAGDNDGPGTALMGELARRLDVERCFQVTWPDGCKDANDVLVHHGKDKLRECIDAARPWPVAGLLEFKRVETELWDIFVNGIEPGLSTGWESIDKFYTVKPGELTIVTGVPGHSKSTWLCALFVNLVNMHGWKFCMFSPEHEQKRMGITLMQQFAKKPYGLKWGMSEGEWAKAFFKLDNYMHWIGAEDASPTIDYILDMAKIDVYRRGTKGLLIDPWNEVDHSRPNNFTETEYISSCLSKLKRFALTHGVHVWVVAHPTKLAKATSGNYAGKYPPPTPYDISGSAHFRNKASNCISLWCDVENKSTTVEIHVQKVKLPEIGRPGVAQLEFDRKSATFRDLGDMTATFD